MFVSANSPWSVMCAGLCQMFISVSVFSFHFPLPTSYSPPCCSKNGDQKRYFLCIRLQGRGKRRDTQLHMLNVTEGKAPRKVFNIRYETTLIFSKHTWSYFKGWNSKQRGGVSHFWGVVTNVTWVWHALWKERCIHISSYWCSGCHGNGPLNKGYVDHYGVTHTQRQASLIT